MKSVSELFTDVAQNLKSGTDPRSSFNAFSISVKKRMEIYVKDNQRQSALHLINELISLDIDLMDNIAKYLGPNSHSVKDLVHTVSSIMNLRFAIQEKAEKQWPNDPAWQKQKDGLQRLKDLGKRPK